MYLHRLERINGRRGSIKKKKNRNKRKLVFNGRQHKKKKMLFYATSRKEQRTHTQKKNPQHKPKTRSKRTVNKGLIRNRPYGEKRLNSMHTCTC